MNQQNCPVCDSYTWLVLGELYEVTSISCKESPHHVVVTLVPHRCKKKESS